MTKRACITGITGQASSYSTELLLGKGYEVHGRVCRASTFNTHRLDHIYVDAHDPLARFLVHYGDLSDGSRLVTLVGEIQPDGIYNLAAQSHVRVSFDGPEHTADTTGGSIRLLEAQRQTGVTAPFYPRSPYGEGMWRMLQADEPDDFVLATGVGYTISDSSEVSFGHAGLEWKQYVKFDERYLRPA